MAYTTQNSLLLDKLIDFYMKENNMERILPIINGESSISLRLIDWFTTNYAKQKFIVYHLNTKDGSKRRFNVYIDYKLKLKAYSKRRFDPFCRWDRINIPYKKNELIQTTIGQLNFFKWALENKILDYIIENLETIEKDMNKRNSTAKRKDISDKKTRKKKRRVINFSIKKY